MMPSVLAVAAVAALITSLAVWQGEQADKPSAAVSAGGSTSPSTSAAQADRPATSAAPSPSSAAPSSAQRPSGETKVEGTKAAQSENTSDKQTPQAPASDMQDMQVVVLNQTTRRGLAATVADQLRSSGWPVPAVGNFRGIVPSTTVYYPPGGEAGALAVAADLPVEPRVRPSFGNLSETRLTVVVTDSYPS